MTKPMNPHRKAAIIAGVLFLIALILNPIAMAIYQPILNAPDFLVNAFLDRILMTIGLLLDFLCIPAIILIPIVLYHVFKQHFESMALGYVGFRAVEGILFIFSVIKFFTLLNLSKDYLNDGAPNIASFKLVGNSIQAEIQCIFLIYVIFFAIGVLFFYTMLYQSKLVPRLLSVWGFFAAVVILAGAVLGLFDVVDSTKIMMFCGPPIGINELVVALWLIVKGFDTTALQTVSA